MRPVLLAPWAAGANPTTTRRVAGSPKPGTGRAQYSSSLNEARFSRPTCSRHATSRGQDRHVTTSSAKVLNESTLPDGSVGHDMANQKNPPPTLALLVRHGQTPTTGASLPGRAPGLHLAETGRAQADSAAARLGVLSTVEAVYASPLERTRETAAPIAKALGQKVRVNRGLLECDFGDWTGRKLSDLRRTKEWETVQRYPSGFRFPAGESFTEMQQRMVATLGELVEQHRGRAFVAVSHADPSKAAVAHALGTHLDLFQRIVVSPCSVTAVLYTATGPVVLAVNSTGSDLTSLAPS